MSDNSTDRLLLRANTAIKILQTSRNTPAFQMKTWDWLNTFRAWVCFLFYFLGFLFFLKGGACFLQVLKIHWQHVQPCSTCAADAGRGGKKQNNATCAFFLKKNGYGVYDRLITYRKGDFLFWGHGNKDYKWQPLDLDSHGFSLRSNWFSKTHTHKPFSLYLNICHLQTEKKLNFSDQATGPLVQSWLNNDNNMLLICLFELFTVFLVCFGVFFNETCCPVRAGIGSNNLKDPD